MPFVLGHSGHVKPDPTVPAKPVQSTDTTIQLDSTQEPVIPKSPCSAPRATAIKEQEFSDAMAARSKRFVQSNSNLTGRYITIIAKLLSKLVFLLR